VLRSRLAPSISDCNPYSLATAVCLSKPVSRVCSLLVIPPPQIKPSGGASIANVSAVPEAPGRMRDLLHDLVVTGNQPCRDYSRGQEPSRVLLT
jgi:hypothetical protein